MAKSKKGAAKKVAPAKNPITKKIVNRKPLLGWETIVKLGEDAHKMAVDDKGVMKRLPNGLTDQLEDDVAALGGKVRDAKKKTIEKIGGSINKQDELALAYARVTAVRQSVDGTSSLSAESKHLWGVGVRTSAESYDDVVVAIDLILQRATDAAEEATAIGFLDEDKTAFEEAKTSVTAAKERAKSAREAGPRATEERNLAGQRIIASVKKISERGVMQHPVDETKRQSFANLKVRANSAEKTMPAESKPIAPVPNVPVADPTDEPDNG